MLRTLLRRALGPEPAPLYLLDALAGLVRQGDAALATELADLQRRQADTEARLAELYTDLPIEAT